MSFALKFCFEFWSLDINWNLEHWDFVVELLDRTYIKNKKKTIVDMKRRVYTVFLFLGDILFLYLSLLFALLIRYKGFPVEPSVGSFFLYFTWLFLIWLFFLWSLELYSPKLQAGSFDFFRFLLIFIFLSVFSGTLYFYLQPNLPVAPKTILFLQIGIFSLLFLLWRVLFDFLFRKKRKREKIIILGNSPELEDLLSSLKNSFFYQVIGVYNGQTDSQKIKEIIEKKKVKKIIVSNGLEFLRDISFFSRLEIESFANFYEEVTQKVPLSVLKNSRFLEEFYKREERSYLILKRAFDLFFSFIGILILAVLYPLIALLIKIDSPGPVIFSQERIGKNRQKFRSYKFRSMFSSSEEKTKLWREKDKKEITTVGRFLRYTHLDELPQCVNIFKGDLSFVGPRPEWEKIARIYEKEIPFYFLRYTVKPGLTGWAQLNFSPSRSVEEAKIKFQYDLYYIKHRSVLFDLSIFLKSLKKVFG